MASERKMSDSEEIHSLMSLLKGRPMTNTVLEKVLRVIPPTRATGHVAGSWASVASGGTLPAHLESKAFKAVEEWKSSTYGSHYGYHSFMGGGKARFHPEPKFFYLEIARNQVAWLKKKVGFSGTLPADVVTAKDHMMVHSCLKELMELVGATSVDRYIKTTDKKAPVKPIRKKKGIRIRARPMRFMYNPYGRAKNVTRATCRAQLTLSGGTVSKTQKSTPFKYFGDYKRALKFVSEFAGRVHTWSDPWITAKALRLAKVGLIDEVLNEHSDALLDLPLTSATIGLMISEFGARKEFTLEKQKQGALNPHLETLLNEVKRFEPEGLRFIAYIYPTPEIFKLIPVTDVVYIHTKWSEWMPVFAGFLEVQWKKGVAKASRRTMRVLPRGARVNTTGWNAVADAWQNGCRFLRLAVSEAGIEGEPIYLKVLQLIANDQFGWGCAANKKMDPNVAVFHNLTAKGFLPWDAVLRPKSFDSAGAVIELSRACSLHLCSLQTWLGLPKVRTEDVRKHVDMICGVPVPPMSVDCADFLTSLGIFGAREWSGN